MGKQTRKEKKAEEKRILAEFEQALQEERGGTLASEEESGQASGKNSFYASADPERVHCKRCKTLMERGVCPACGYKIYQPMSEEKRKKIRSIVTVALVALAAILVMGLLRG